ncbi:MAG: efflux RND transporter periplasmic adaptor subunit [Desulfobacterales bacterium]
MKRLIVFSFVLAFWIGMPLLCAEPVPVTTGTVEYNGLIEPHLVVELGSEVPGVLEAVNVDRGNVVSAGQVVARLRSGVEKATLALARARADMESNIKAKKAALEYARRNSKRISDLYEVNALPMQKWDEVDTQRILAETELAAALDQKRLHELEFHQADEAVKRKTITSPISGVIMERYLAKGEYVEDKPILKIAQIDPLNVEVILPVSAYGSVQVGMSGTVKPEPPVGGAYEAEVTIVDKVIDAASGTFGVRLEIPNPGFELPPGLKCRVEFHETS